MTKRRKIYPKKGETPTSRRHLARRLRNGIAVIQPGKCWEWCRALSSGYGTLTIEGKTQYAHRLSYELAKGPIPRGMDVMHSCDNPRCINPGHLEIGTRSKNMKDCHARGRSRIPSPRLNGEANGSSKLTERKVAEIRGELAIGVSQGRLADKYGVSQTTISKIARGVTWKKIDA